MNTAATIICCLIPCIGIVIGCMLTHNGKKKESSSMSGASGAVVKAAGSKVLAASVVLLVVAVLVLTLVPISTPKTRLVTAILLVTVQYAAAMVLIFVISGMLHKDKKNRSQIQNEEKN